MSDASQQQALRASVLWLGLACFGLMVLPWFSILDTLLALTGHWYVGIGPLAAGWAVVLAVLLPIQRARVRRIVRDSANRDPSQRADDMALFRKQKEMVVAGIFLGLLPALIATKILLYFFAYI